MALTTNTISGLVPAHTPQYWQDQFPNLIAFIQAYYQFLESPGNPVYGIRKFLDNTNIDNASEAFLAHIASEFLPYWPSETALSLRKLLKVATQFYQSKGSQNSIEFLFRVLYGIDAQVYAPSQQVMKLSAGNWQLPQAVKIVLSARNQGFDTALLQGRRGTGATSNTTCVIESATMLVDPTLNQEILELFLSNINGEFISGETMVVNCGTYANGMSIVFSDKIIGSISDIKLNPNALGLKYVGTKYYSNGAIQYQGDPVSIIGGLANANDIIMAEAYVGNVSQGSLSGIQVNFGAYGYQLDPNTIVSVVDAPGDTGSGAVASVDGVDTANQVYLLLNTDSLAYKKNVTLGATSYGFTKFANANQNTTFADALSYVNIAVAPLTSISVTARGSGYTQIPSITLESIFKTDWASDLWQDYLVTPTTQNYTNYLNAVGKVGDPGTIAAVVVLNGGSGYKNTDTVVVNSAYGYDAEFILSVDANGAITNVNVSNGGYGFQTTLPPILVNSNTGSGAILQAYGYGQGATYTLSVSQIGQIQSIRLVNDGFDYVSTPLVSLRNMDVTITPISNSIFYQQTDRVYQGADINSASFIAYVDKYDRSNSILRLYNYIGTLNVSASLVGNNVTATVVSATTYGNGKALATADFFGGLIEYPGFWLGTSGQLSSDQHIQDASLYQNFSYLIKVEKSLADYQKTIQKIVHPAGVLMGAICTITSGEEYGDSVVTLPIELANTSNTPGSVSVDAFANGILIGTNTTFTGNVSNGDLIKITRGAFISTKGVANVINNTTLLLESNTFFFGTDLLTITSGSNVAVAPNNTTVLAANDIIQMNINGNVQTSIVISVTGGNVETNTVFSVNASNVYYQAWPSINNATYSVLT